MSKLTKIVEERLRDAGWYPGRDVFSELVISEHKILFDKSIQILSEFGLLEVSYHGKTQDEEEILYFDVDESDRSKTLRARMFGYENHYDKELISEMDYSETEDHELIESVSNKLKTPCTRVATKEDALGFDIYVVPDGSIYLAHHDIPEKRANSFYEYLNKTIVG